MIETTISIQTRYLQNIYTHTVTFFFYQSQKSSNVHMYNVGKIISRFQSTKVKYQKILTTFRRSEQKLYNSSAELLML